MYFFGPVMYRDDVVMRAMKEVKKGRKKRDSYLKQEELRDVPITVRAVKQGSRYLIDHKQLRKGLTYRRGYVFIMGICIPITKLRQWLIQALKDPGTGRMIKDFDREDWATIWHVEKVQLANKTYDEGPSLIITLPKRGSMKARATFVHDWDWGRTIHEVVFDEREMN